MHLNGKMLGTTQIRYLLERTTDEKYQKSEHNQEKKVLPLSAYVNNRMDRSSKIALNAPICQLSDKSANNPRSN